MEQASALALPLMGRLLGHMSKTIAEHRLGLGPALAFPQCKKNVSDEKKEGPDSRNVAGKFFRFSLVVRPPWPPGWTTICSSILLLGTPAQLLVLLGDVAARGCWFTAGTSGHTGVILTMGRDQYRGRLEIVKRKKKTGVSQDSRRVASQSASWIRRARCRSAFCAPSPVGLEGRTPRQPGVDDARQAGHGAQPGPLTHGTQGRPVTQRDRPVGSGAQLPQVSTSWMPRPSRPRWASIRQPPLRRSPNSRLNTSSR